VAYCLGVAADNALGSAIISTTARDYYSFYGSFANMCRTATGELVLNVSCIADMTANDTAKLTVYVAGHASKNVGVGGTLTIFSGILLSRN
jgi:hypothetical protein